MACEGAAQPATTRVDLDENVWTRNIANHLHEQDRNSAHE
jgi:hypothetical protein